MANQNSSTGKIQSFNKGMAKDYANIFIGEGIWLNAINAINKTHLGELGTIGNEPSNYNCINATYTIIGFAYIEKNKWVIFCTNDTNSEIGIFHENICEYTVLVNDTCLNFNKANLITAVVKENYDCTFSVYWQDNNNPDRVMNINNIPWVTEMVTTEEGCIEDCCYEEVSIIPLTLDCDKILLHPKIVQPCIKVSKNIGSGQLINGSYMAVIAYSENGIRLTDYSIPSNIQSIWDHTGIGGSIKIEINNLDQSFEEFELVIIGTVAQNTVAKKIGNYSIRQNIISLDIIHENLQTVPLAQIPLKSVVYEKSRKMFDINGYLIRTSPTTLPYINYQPQANKIQALYQIIKYPANYYWNGGNKVGYMRDEVYSFFIRWVYDIGMRTHSYHIPGRELIQGVDDKFLSGDNEVLDSKETMYWQVHNTADEPQPYLIPVEVLDDGGEVVAYGKMGYWESTEHYPDNNEEVWGDLCGKPIRHHKMPSNEQTHIHSDSTLENNIYILGVKFKNIEPPRYEAGNLIPNIIGYEILRGSREGNKTIIAKGMFNNMWEFEYKNSGNANPNRKGLYQNYPYNDLRADPFLTSNVDLPQQVAEGLGGGGSGYINKIENCVGTPTSPHLHSYKKNTFSFHSPDTTFYKPYLGSGLHVKIYTEEKGIAVGNYEIPYKHPKFKFVTDTAFGTSIYIGIGIGLLAALGKYSVSSTAGPSVPVAAMITTTKDSTAASLPGDLSTNILAPYNIPGTLAGVINFGVSFVYYAGQGVDQVLKIFWNLLKYRDFALQYNSHALYNQYIFIKNAKNNMYRRNITNAKYISTGIHEFNKDYTINNINRNKYVCLEVEKVIDDPQNTDYTRMRLQDVTTSNVIYERPEDYGNVTSLTSAYYGAIKVKIDNQYGQIDSIMQLPVSCVMYPDNSKSNISDVIFGGDVYINRYTEKNPFYFFNDWLFDVLDGTEFNYSNYINGPIPRYWANFNKFDIEDFDITPGPGVVIAGLNIPTIAMTTPSDMHRLDRGKCGANAKGVFGVKNAWFYLFYNGIRDFYCESEINLAYRDYGDEIHEKFYDPYGFSFNDISMLFRSDLIKHSIFHKYDYSLSASRIVSSFITWGNILPRDYKPSLYSSCFEYFPKRVIYSLQQQEGMRRDNWRSFLPLNYKDFNDIICSIKSLNATGAIILFENSEPRQFVGVDQFKSEGGVKVSIGDGGLFATNMQGLVNADDELEYGACISSRSAINTAAGLFYVSQNIGKIFQYGEGMIPISDIGMKMWFAKYLPSKLLEIYPDYPLYDNPVKGIGVQAIYDSIFDILYITKKDYLPLVENLLVNENGEFYYEETIEYKTCEPGYTLDIVNNVCVQNEASLEPCYSEGCEKEDMPYGLFYNFYAMVDSREISSGDQNFAVPTKEQWETLVSYLGGSTVAGGKLKAIGFTYWDAPNTGATDEVGFAARGSSIRNYDGVMYPTVKDSTLFWSSTADTATKSFVIRLEYNTDEITIASVKNEYGFSVRYVRLATIAEQLLADGTECDLYKGNTRSYKTVKIGTQVWTSENLADSKYRNNDDILLVEDNVEWSILSEGAFCYKNNVKPLCLCPPIIREKTIKIPCHFDNPKCWKPASWTVSYDTMNKMWLSFHDWHPDLLMPSNNHFYSIKDNGVWKHNELWNSYNTYYGESYDFEIEFPITTPNNITTLRSIEYTLEVFKYYNDGKDYNHLLDANFDRAVIYNSEQISGLLKLNLKGKNSPLDLITYPIVTPLDINILYSKEENKYRINQFWDITKDRGEFSGNTTPMWITEENGYRKTINPSYTEYMKLERKKFRHYGNIINLKKRNTRETNSHKFILKLLNTKHLNSQR